MFPFLDTDVKIFLQPWNFPLRPQNLFSKPLHYNLITYSTAYWFHIFSGKYFNLWFFHLQITKVGINNTHVNGCSGDFIASIIVKSKETKISNNYATLNFTLRQSSSKKKYSTFTLLKEKYKLRYCKIHQEIKTFNLQYWNVGNSMIEKLPLLRPSSANPTK